MNFTKMDPLYHVVSPIGVIGQNNIRWKEREDEERKWRKKKIKKEMKKNLVKDDPNPKFTRSKQIMSHWQKKNTNNEPTPTSITVPSKNIKSLFCYIQKKKLEKRLKSMN